MPTTILLVISLLLQLAAAGWALWLVRKSRSGWGWSLLALGLLLMAFRRGVFFVTWMLEGKPSSPHYLADALLSVVISTFLLLAVALTGRLFIELAKEKESVSNRSCLLEQERRRLAELLARLPVGVAVEDQAGLVYANPEFLKLLGLEEKDGLGKKCSSLVAEEDWQALQGIWQESSDTAGRVEVRMLRADGERFWAAVRWLSGSWQEEPARFWVVVDITERKHREAEKATTAALFSQGPVVLIRWRPAPERNVAFVSENIRAWGFQAEELMKDPEAFYKWVHPEDRKAVPEEAKNYFAAGAESWSQRYRLVCPDGKTRWVLDRTVVAKDPSGQVIAFDGSLLDVTEAMETGRILEEERARYAAALEATGEVVYDWDVGDGSILWNRNVTKAFGYSQEEMGVLPSGRSGSILRTESGWSSYWPTR